MAISLESVDRTAGRVAVDTIIGAIIGAVATLAAVVPFHFLNVKRIRASEEKGEQKKQIDALQRVIDTSHDVGFIDNPSVRDFPDYAYTRVAELRNVVLEAQGALPSDSEDRPRLERIQDVTGKLRQKYRMLERPLGRPDPVKVTREDFEPFVEDFLSDVVPLLGALEKRVQSAAAVLRKQPK
jgi:hypothetical protein